MIISDAAGNIVGEWAAQEGDLFGGGVAAHGNPCGIIEKAAPFDACEDIESLDDKGIVLIIRGSCAFGDKSVVASTSGAIASTPFSIL